MATDTAAVTTESSRPAWYQSLAQYAQPDLKKAIWQLLNTFIPYAALWILVVYLMQQGYSYWLVLALSLIQAALLVRIFIFFHDCGHGSFFASRRANQVLGYVAGILTFTPYEQWRLSHAGHHATAGNLDRRGTGDVWTMTVDEYQAAPRWKRFVYRVIRNPLVIFGLGAGLSFVFGQRWPRKDAKKAARNSVIYTDLAIIAIIVLASLTIGLRTYLLIQTPIIFLAAAGGVWLFYVQHQFEGVYWARQDDWDPVRAALEGSSYYRLPGVLQWFSGNIGLHHIHHLRPRIPNYHLQQCYDEVPEMQTTVPLTIRRSLKSLRMNLWDEEQQKLVSFRSLKAAT